MFTYHARIKAISHDENEGAPMAPDEVLAWAAIQQTDILVALLERLDGISSKLDQIDNTIAGK